MLNNRIMSKGSAFSQWVEQQKAADAAEEGNFE